MIEEVDHPKLGRMPPIVGIPTKSSKTPGKVRTAAPTLGQDTDAVLRRSRVPEYRIAEMRARSTI